MAGHRPAVVGDEDAAVPGGCLKHLRVGQTLKPGSVSRLKIYVRLPALQRRED